MGRKMYWVATAVSVLLFGWQVTAGAASAIDLSGAQSPAAVQADALGRRAALFDFPRIELETHFSLYLGLRRDSFKWSVAAAGGHPNILSELTWSDVEAYQVGLSNHSRIGRFIYLRWDLALAQIQSGSVRDSDYAADHRNQEYSRSISTSSGDSLLDFSLGIGIPFTFRDGRLMVAPLIGGSLHKQNFRITDGYQVVTSPGKYPLGPLPDGLNSTYQAKWDGFWLGCDLRYDLKFRNPDILPMQVAFSAEYHWTRYTAKADWNLRSDLAHPISFQQDADAGGISLQGRWSIELSPHLDLDLIVRYHDWSTTSGRDRFNHLSHPHTRRFNGADWDSRSVMLGLTYQLF